MFVNWQQQMDMGKQALLMHDPATARIYFEAAIKEAQSFGHNNSSLALSLEVLADAILSNRESQDSNADIQKSLECYKRAASIYEAVHGPRNQDLARCLTSLAAATMVFDIVTAEAQARRAISIYAELDSTDVVKPIQVLAAILGLTGRGKEREVMLSELVDNLKNKSTLEPSALASGLYCLAGACENNETAIIYLEHARRIFDDTCGAEQRVQIDVLLGKLYFAEELFSCCETVLKEAIDLGQCAPSVSSLDFEEALCRLSRLNLYYYQNYAEAKRLLSQVEEIKEFKACLPFGANLETEYANFAAVTGDYTKHIQFLREGLEQVRQSEAEWARSSVSLHAHSLASVLQESGNRTEAIAIWEQALNECVPVDGADSYHAILIAVSLGLEYAKDGRLKEAEALANRAIDNVTQGALPSVAALLLELEHKIGRELNIDFLVETLVTRIEKLEVANEEDTYEELPSTCIGLALGLAKIGRLAEAKVFLKKGLAVGKTDSFFRAPFFESLACKFADSGAPELGSLLAKRAMQIRVVVSDKEKARGANC